MISFSELTADNADMLKEELRAKIQPEDVLYFEDSIFSMLELIEEDPDTGVGLSAFSGCLLVRVFDYGRYMFAYPIAEREDADVMAAIREIASYARREEIPLVLTDVPKGEIGMLLGRYRHITLDAEDADAASYRAEIKSECELLCDMPEISAERITLSAPTEDDITEIARLARDESVNKYWGYNYLSDIGEVADEYFYENSIRSFESGASMSMAIRYEGKYVGEAEYYSFDLMGGAEPVSASIDRVFRVIEKHYGVSKEDLLSEKRLRDIVMARHAAIYLLKKITGMSYPSLAKVFNKKNHTTMLSSYQLILRKVEDEPAFALEMNNLEKEASERI